MSSSAATKKAVRKSSKKRAYETSEINAQLSKEEKVGLFRTIVGIRRFEERSLQAYNQGKIGGFLHLYIGQEAVATGIVSLMEENDHIITAYRDHGHALAVGMSMNECMAELFGKYTGCSKGKGGSMHYFAPDKGFWGGHGIVAGQTPLGAGLAFALKYKGIKGCAVCFLGDGAVNQGSFMETLNLVSLWGIPVVFVIENNGYSMGTSLKRSSAEESLAKEVKLLGSNGIPVKVMTFSKFVKKPMKRCRTHEKNLNPTYLKFAPIAIVVTLLLMQTMKSTAQRKKLRPKKNKDPINVLRKKLIADKTLTEATAKEIDQEMKVEADTSAKFAEESPYPPKSEITKDVYWSVDNDTDQQLKGTYFFND